MNQPHKDYHSLRNVLDMAYDQASAGKGKERHAQSKPFEEQPMQVISELLGTHQGLLYQAVKKCQESTRMPTDRAINELLGAIVYTAGAVIQLQKQQAPAAEKPKERSTGPYRHLFGSDMTEEQCFAELEKIEARKHCTGKEEYQDERYARAIAATLKRKNKILQAKAAEAAYDEYLTSIGVKRRTIESPVEGFGIIHVHVPFDKDDAA
jgi:hypothetical protein